MKIETLGLLLPTNWLLLAFGAVDVTIDGNQVAVAEPLQVFDPRQVLHVQLLDPQENDVIKGSEIRVSATVRGYGAASNATEAKLAAFIASERVGVCMRMDNATVCAPISESCCVLGRVAAGYHFLVIWLISLAKGQSLSSATNCSFKTVGLRRQTGGLPYERKNASFPSTKVSMFRVQLTHVPRFLIIL
jgi:hypothetical protein